MTAPSASPQSNPAPASPAPASPAPASPAPASSGPAGTGVAGAGSLLRFMLRRERRALPWWLLGAGLMMYFQSKGSQGLYDSPEKLAELRETMEANPAVTALGGPKQLLDTVGGETVFEIFSFVVIVLALMNMFLMGRHTRADEETGRAELIRSARVGRHATLAAALGLAGLANLLAGVVLFAAATASGLPAGGSVLVGVSAAGVGLSFAALSAVAVQVFDNVRTAYGAIGAALGIAYLLRAVGDVGDGTLSWLSPIGWGQQTLPYVENRWWPLALPLASTVACAAVAVCLLTRRDFAAGLLRSRPGPATASRTLGSSLGLAWRLHRGALAGWTAGLFVLGAVFGSFADSIEDYVTDNPDAAKVLTGGAADAVDAYLAFAVVVLGLLAAACGISSALRARSEETSWRAEPILATRTSRWDWLASHVTMALVGSTVALVAGGLGAGAAYGLAISDPGQVPRLCAVALAYAPAMWLLVALAVLGFGWLPRAAAGFAWAALTFCSLVTIFADVLDLPTWLTDASPFVQTPQVPMERVAATPLLAMVAIVAAAVAAGFVGFRRRDFG